ncbi:hypothetical protein SELMODRAFT_31855, partial [Selaginella moellendorffii]
VECAQALFDSMPDPNNFSWTFLLSAYARNGYFDRSKRVFDAMALNRCHDVVSWTILLKGFSESGRIEEMEEIFARMPARSVISFHTVFVAHKNAKNWDEASRAFLQMPEHDLISWTGMIQSYAGSGRIDRAEEMFGKIPARNTMCCNSMILAFADAGHLDPAKALFDSMPEKNEVSWNAMLAIENLEIDELHLYFERMPQRSIASWRAIVAENAAKGDLFRAKNTFDQMPEHSASSWSAMIMIAALGSDGDVGSAREIFDSMAEKEDIVARTAMIHAYARNGDLEQARSLFDVVELHSRDAILWNTMIAAYSQSGDLDEAREILERMPHRDVMAWTALMAQENGGQAMAVVAIMQLEGVAPNGISFVAVLGACGHDGFVASAGEYFRSMRRDYGLDPAKEHYGSMLLGLGRAGMLDAAEELMESMPFEPDAAMWGEILSACQIHGDVDRAWNAALRLGEMDPRDSATYVSLGNI